MGADPLKPAVVLARPQEEGNIGATARAMANTGLDELILVRPPALGAAARAFAVHAGGILDGARAAESVSEALAPYRTVVGTTSSRGREVDGKRVLTPRELPDLLAGSGAPSALLFGPEASGLTRDELAPCAWVVTIPAAARQPTLNLGQAVLVLAYEIFVAREGGATAPPPGEPAASTADVEQLFAQLEPRLEQIGFARDDTFAGVLRELRQLAARAGLTEREVAILLGICRRASRALSRRAG